jgi:hypothetical protein
MGNLIELLTKQIQLWLGETISIRPTDVAKLLANAQAEALKEVKRVKISIEGEPQEVALVTAMLKTLFQAEEQKAAQPMLDDGRIRRELEIQGQAVEEMPARPGNLDPQVVAGGQPERQEIRRPPADSLIHDALYTIARGLLEFPQDEEGRRRFGGAYPATFKAGIGKLNAYLLSQGVSISDPLDFWRILSQPLQDWPHMPPDLRSPDKLIDSQGRTTALTEHLARDQT